ncbi:carboxypeptidase-like regulatory domain-containing protein [Ascidiimonas sp. W6]|uniref:carboxypeptidase-like regulatory domain-containing protein n=1 Tax=Ascidiimonas meishanensis TaxID=3128903 RepID=UPI0030EC4D6C
MKKIYCLLLILSTTFSMFSQDNDRVLLRGTVLYRSNNVPNENVVNITTEKATVTNENGEFQIYVKEGDELVFSAVNYRIESVIIDQNILKNKRLVVEVIEKVTELDEVTVSPDSEEAFLKLQEEKFKKVDYEQDASTQVTNVALPQSVTGLQNGLNFVNIFKAIFKSNKEKDVPAERQIKMSEVLRQVYEDDFFVTDLKIPSDKIEDFLYYLDTKMPASSLLKKDNEFELIDFLVNQSKDFLKTTQN